MQAEPTQNGATPYTLHEAAQLLGVSLNTVRRKIARGELRATQVPRPQGHVWHVWLERPQDAAQDAAQHPTQGSTQHPANGYVQDAGSILALERADQLARALVPLVEAAVAPLRAELADSRAAVETAREEVGRLRAQLEQAQERILALEAPREPTPAEMTTAEARDGLPVEPSSQPAVHKRPWWRLW